MKSHVNILAKTGKAYIMLYKTTKQVHYLYKAMDIMSQCRILISNDNNNQTITMRLKLVA